MDVCGFVVARKSDYYSPLPSRRRLKATMGRWSKPSSLLGVAYDIAAMKGTLADLVARYHEEFMGLLPYEEALALGLVQVIHGWMRRCCIRCFARRSLHAMWR